MIRLKVLLATGAALAALPLAAQGGRQAQPRFKIDSVTSQQFRAYLRTLRFSVDTEAGDRQALMFGHYPDSARLGPVATILPQERAYGMSREQLERGEVIAVIGNESADSYPKLGLLPHATTYWWVEYNDRTEHGRSVFITVNADSNIVARAYRGLEVIKSHRRYRALQPLARFIWTSVDDLAWGWCGPYCCRSTPQVL
jgi:hypothetical protein